MALRVKCKCGKVLAVSSKLADKRITCPGCKKPFLIPLAKFLSAEKPAAATVQRAASPTAARPQAGQTARGPVATNSAPADLEPVIADLSGTIGVSPSGIFGEIELDGSSAASFLPPAPVAVDVGDPVELSYAREHVSSTMPAATSRQVSAAIEGPKRTYWSDALRSFVYPFSSGGNVANLIVISIISLIVIPLHFAGFYGLFGVFIIFGWVRAMYLSVVQDTAAGSDDMPGIKMEDGFLEDIIKPAFKYIGSYAVALLPAAAYTIGMATGLVPGAMQSEFILLAWIAGGIFLWPVFLMLFAFGALNMIHRVDLIFATIFRTIVPYLSLWLMLLLVGFLSTLPWLGDILDDLNINITLPALPDLGLAGKIIYLILDVYFSIVSMRLIGLYYLHFKRRFAIVME